MLNRIPPKDKEELDEPVVKPVAKHVAFASSVHDDEYEMISLHSTDKEVVTPSIVEPQEDDDSDSYDDTADLCGKDLSGQDLKLYHHKMRGAWLFKANMQSTELIYKDMSRACACQADFSKAAMLEANLHHAYFINAKFFQTHMVAVDAAEADFTGAFLQRANLANSTLTDTYFTRANLARSNLSGANLENADMRHANLFLASLRSANLKGAKLDGTEYFPLHGKPDDFKQVLKIYKKDYFIKNDDGEYVMNGAFPYLRPHMCADLINKVKDLEKINPVKARDVLVMARENPLFAKHRNERLAKLKGFFTRQPVLTHSQDLLNAEIARLNALIPAAMNIEMKDMANPEVSDNFNAEDVEAHMNRMLRR